MSQSSRYFTRRIALLIPVLAVVSLVTFALVRLAPGDPALLFLGLGATDEQVEALREDWGLDQAMPLQFAAWVGRALKGDLGDSLRFGQPVTEVLANHVGPTLSIVGVAMLLTVIVGITLGLLAGRYRGSLLDRVTMGGAFLGVSIPEFWVGLLLLMVFASWMAIFPMSGYVRPGKSLGAWLFSIALPSITLALSQIALLARTIRDSVITSASEPWVLSLHARGISWRRITGIHQLKSALIPAITVIGNSIGVLITGAVVVEVVFNIRGLGWLTVNSTLQRDYPLVQGAILLSAVAYAVINVVVDYFYFVIDPRIRMRG